MASKKKKKFNEPMIKVGKMKTLEELENFFEFLYGTLNKKNYGRLWTDDGEHSYTIDTSTEEGRKVMAKTAYLLRKAGYSVNFGAVPRSAVNNLRNAPDDETEEE